MDHLNQLSDEELAELARDGIQSAFSVLVDRYANVVYRLAYGITGVVQDAEDIVQETFLKAFSHISAFSPSKASFKTWLLTIARNQSINVFSSLKRRTLRFLNELDADTESHGAGNPFRSASQDAEELMSVKQEYRKVKQALRKLPERQRTAVLLKAQENMSYSDIARIMNTTASSVESLIFRARKKILDMVEE
jgi:RNA polymerase sigma-70 factor (ECF subfamily)